MTLKLHARKVIRYSKPNHGFMFLATVQEKNSDQLLKLAAYHNTYPRIEELIRVPLGALITVTKYQRISSDRIQFNRNTEFTHEPGEFLGVPLREFSLDAVDPNGFSGIITTQELDIKAARVFNVHPACSLCHVPFKEGDVKCEICKNEDACLQICTIVRLEDTDGRSIRAFLDTNAFSKITGRELGPTLDEAISKDSCLEFVQEIVGKRVNAAISNNRNPNPGGKLPPVYTVETILSPDDLTGDANQNKRLRRRR